MSKRTVILLATVQYLAGEKNSQKKLTAIASDKPQEFESEFADNLVSKGLAKECDIESVAETVVDSDSKSDAVSAELDQRAKAVEEAEIALVEREELVESTESDLVAREEEIEASELKLAEREKEVAAAEDRLTEMDEALVNREKAVSKAEKKAK